MPCRKNYPHFTTFKWMLQLYHITKLELKLTVSKISLKVTSENRYCLACDTLFDHPPFGIGTKCIVAMLFHRSTSTISLS